MRDPLSRLDSATLRAWRTTNVVVWTLAGFLTAFVTHVAAFSLAWTFLPPSGSIEPSLESVGRIVLQATVSALAGLTAGGVIGARAWRHPEALAGIAAGGYVVVAAVLFWQGGLDVLGIHPSSFGESLGTSALLVGYVVALALSVPAAVAWSRRIWVRRLV